MSIILGRGAFAGALLLSVLVAPHAVDAQRADRVYRIGVLEPTPQARNSPNVAAFRQGLRELGYVEGRNLVIEYRAPVGGATGFSDAANELVRSNVDVIVTRGTPAVMAARNATRTIPIVMAASGDPLGTGVVAGLVTSGGNVTGLSAFTSELSSKRLQLLREAVPGSARIGALLNSGNPAGEAEWKAIERATGSVGIRAALLDVRNAEDLGRAFDAAIERRLAAVIVGLDTVMQNNVGRIVDLAAKHRLPAMFASREFVEAGGLIAYGVSYPDLYRRAAAYVDKVLKGAKPADLPIEQPMKFELVINLRTASTLGVTIPPSLRLQADRVIE
ncbi:MAG: ABC transporter substrate-binding protein [Candidatus Rokubacteria bacterium]|nr:ABC transporter substrate-binding protein [Candidatus Rokubacteria bacterium]